MGEERRLRVFENMVLKRIFGPRRDEVMGEWRRFHNEELNDLSDRLCGLVVRVTGYRYRGPGFDPRRYQIF